MLSNEPPPLKYSHPFTVADLHDLDIALIGQEVERLQKSLSLLMSTNAQLQEALADEGDAKERADYESIIEENDEAMAKQRERVQMCIWVLQKKLGIAPGSSDASASSNHYRLDPDTTAITIERRNGPAAPQALSANDIHMQDASFADARTQETQPDMRVEYPSASEDPEDSEHGLYL